MSSPGNERLNRWEKLGLAGVALLVVAFGVITEIRSAFQVTRKTDAGVYFRAAWAARTGTDLFAAVDNNGWHFCYPPAFALLVMPLADPMPGESRTGYLPYAVSVALWYLFGVGCVGWSVHTLAATVLPDAVRGTRRWWYARTVPVFVCIGGIGHTLGRGQVNLFVVALVSAAFAASVANRRIGSGAWLTAAAAVKIIPGFLLLYPLVRRDRHTLVGAAFGGLLLFALIPALWWGDRGMIDLNRQLFEQVVKPGTTGGGDQTRAEELTKTTSTDSQSFVAAIHAWQHPDRSVRPANASREARLAHAAIAGALTLVTGWFGWKRLGESKADQLVYLGCLSAVMLLASPVSHMHYYAFALPLVAGLWLRSMTLRSGRFTADRTTTLSLAAWGVITALPLFPGPTFDRLRECGFGVAATVGLLAYGLSVIGVRGEPVTVQSAEPMRRAA